MRRPQVNVPNADGFGSIGLGWRIGQWEGTQVLAHDGGTLGQTAMLRLVPEHGFACCLLTNSAEGGALEQRLLGQVFAAYTGLTMPRAPEPDPSSRPKGLEQHAGRYRRAVHFEVTVHADRLSIEVIPAGDLDALTGSAKIVEMVPSDESGDRFFGRTDPGLPWWPVEFGRLADGDGERYLCSGGRIALGEWPEPVS